MTSASSVARSQSVVLIEQDGDTLVSNWTDSIVVSRNRRRHFNVYALKYGESMDAGAGRRCETLDSTKGLKDPSTLLAAIEAAADELGLYMDWGDAIPALAELDWVVAAVVAKAVGGTLPSPPTFEELAQQRTSCARKKVEVSVEWGHGRRTIHVPMRDWVEIARGGSYSDEKPCLYEDEGERFMAVLRIDGTEMSLEATYDEGSTGLIGALEEADIRGPRMFGHDVARLLIEASSWYFPPESEHT